MSAPSHCSLMKPAAEKLREKLAGVDFAAPAIPVVNNIDVAVETDADRIRAALYRQAFGPVRWVECVQAIKSRGIGTIVECGPGKVLAGLCKRIDPELTGEVLKVIEGLADDGMTMVLVTHEMAFARSVADQIMFMHQGIVWECGSGDLLGQPTTPELQQFVG